MRRLKHRAKRRRRQLLTSLRTMHRWQAFRAFNVHEWYLHVHGEDPRRP